MMQLYDLDGRAGGSARAAPAKTGRPQRVALGALALGLALLGLWTIQNFLPALVWAAILAIAAWPLYQRACRRFPPGRANIVLPALFTLGIALIFIVPMVILVVQVGREAHNIVEFVGDVQRHGLAEPTWLARIPMAGESLQGWWRQNLGEPGGYSELLRQVRGDIFPLTRTIGSQVVRRTVVFFFTLITLFFLFRDGMALSAQLLRASQRAFGPRGEQLARQMISSVHGTVDGMVLVGIGEGVLIGISYWLVGIPQATLLGALTGIAAMIPYGAPLVFCAASLIPLAQGKLISAAIVLVFGFVVIMIADHAIRPVLIGSATRLPFLWVLIGILGGVEIWGLVGLFLGPAIMAALVMLWREWAADPAPPTTTA